MCKICPNCGAIAEYNAYYRRITCTKCNWESDDMSLAESKKYFSYRNVEKTKKEKVNATVMLVAKF